MNYIYFGALLILTIVVILTKPLEKFNYRLSFIKIITIIFIILLISTTAFFGVLSINDYTSSQNTSNETVGANNYNIYDDNYEEFEIIIEYAVYDYEFSGTNTIFKVKNDDRFISYIKSNEHYVEQYDENNLTIYIFDKNNSLFFLSKEDELDYYLFASNYIKFNGLYVPIIPSQYFTNSSYSYISTEFVSVSTSSSWNEVQQFYSQYYADYITINVDGMTISYVANTNGDIVTISYSDYSITIESGS